MVPLIVTFLGSGDAFNAQGRHHAGYLVQGGDSTLLLDCGATTLASLKRGNISPAAIDTVLISHFHGDHFSGLPFLFLEYTYREKRERPLTIVGPPSIEGRVRSLYRAMYPSSAGEPFPFDIHFREALPNQHIATGAAEVTPFQVPHQEEELSLGFSVEAHGRTIVYSGDTGWTDDLVMRSQNADLFICECSFFDTRLWFHLDYLRLWENRRRFQSRRFILTHIGEEVFRHRNDVELELAHDGLQIQL